MNVGVFVWYYAVCWFCGTIPRALKHQGGAAS